MRVAFLTNNLSPHGVSLVEQIASRVDRFRVFVSAESDEVHGFIRTWGTLDVTVQRSINQLRVVRKAYGFWQTGELHIPFDTMHRLEEFNPDVILSGQLGARTVLAALYKRKHRKKRLILWATLSEHTESSRSWVRRAVRRWIVRQIDGAVVNGKSGERYLRGLGYLGPVAHAPYAIDDRPFERVRYCPEKNTYRLIYTGRLLAQKGLGTFCDALVSWCAGHPEISIVFRLVGDGPEQYKIASLKKPANLIIELIGSVPRVELAEHYNQADVYAFPTFGDEWGVVINEAMISGLPVLGSIYSQAVNELIQEGYDGWIFDPRDSESLSRALDRCFSSSPEKLQFMSGNAKREIGRITPEANGAKIAELIHGCMQGANLEDTSCRI